MTMSEIRKDFWIPTLTRLSKKIIKQCNICKVFAAKPYDPPATGLLHECRLNVTYGFHTAGVDFIGPFICYKRRQEVKTYLIIITCALTRAVWLGVTKTMEVDEFKDKPNQFISNCVRPAEIISDNAKTFGAMANWIKKITRNEKLHDYLAREGIIWKFNLSKAPWWGAMYERLIRDLKRTLFKVIGRTHLTRKEFKREIMDVQVNMNNRPITYVEDELGPRTLSPNSILNVKDQYLLQDVEDISDDDAFSKSEKRIRVKRDHIWKRWVSEYLRALRERHEIKKGGDEFPKVGEIVLIQSEAKNRREWKKGLVTKLIKGKDNIIRGVKLRVGKNEWERPVQVVCPMEIRAHVPVAPDKDIVTEIRALPKRRARDTAKDALIAQTLPEDEDN